MVETSASFEARYAPLLYPTNQVEVNGIFASKFKAPELFCGIVLPRRAGCALQSELHVNQISRQEQTEQHRENTDEIDDQPSRLEPPLLQLSTRPAITE